MSDPLEEASSHANEAAARAEEVLDKIEALEAAISELQSQQETSE